MRTLAVTLVVALAVPASAADTNEDKARAAAVVFLKALKAKDLDAALKVCTAPFLYRDGDKPAVLQDETALKSWLKGRFDEVKNVDKVPTAVDTLTPFADLREKIKDEANRKTVEDVLGKDGFVAFITADGKMIPVLVRVKDGKALVVGLAR
ncbi:MAG: hypothetical protein ACKODX_19520 [Gemmata sp.]